MNKLDCAHLQFESDLGQKHSCSPVQTAFYLAHEMRSLNAFGAGPYEVGTVTRVFVVTPCLNLAVTLSGPHLDQVVDDDDVYYVCAFVWVSLVTGFSSSLYSPPFLLDCKSKLHFRAIVFLSSNFDSFILLLTTLKMEGE